MSQEKSPNTAPPTKSHMLRSRGARFVMLILLVGLMSVPIFMVWGVVTDRASYNQTAIREVSQLWGGRVQIAGPAIHIPVTRIQTRTVQDEFGNENTITNEVEGEPVILLPNRSETIIDAKSQIRSRGIFDVPVYAARININATFDGDPALALGEGERLRPKDAEMILVLPGRRAFFGETTMSINGKAASPEPGTPLSGISGIRIPAPLGALESGPCDFAG